MTPGSTLGTPGDPKSSLFWRGSIFEAIFDLKIHPKIDQKFIFLVKKWVALPLWSYVSSPPDVFSFVGQSWLYFWKAQPLKTLIFLSKNNGQQKNRRFSKDGPRGPNITSKSEEDCPQMLQKTPKRQTNVAFGAVQKHTEKKSRKRLQNKVQRGPKAAWT